MSVEQTVNPTYNIYGPVSASSRPTIVLHLQVNYGDAPPSLSLYTVFGSGSADPDDVSSMRIANAWHKIVLPRADMQSSRLELDTRQLYNLAYSELTDEQKSSFYRPDSVGDQVREEVTDRALSMIMSEMTILLSNKLDKAETRNVRILGYKNFRYLPPLMRQDSRSFVDYTKPAHVQVDPKETEWLEELQSNGKLFLYSAQQ